MLQLHRRLQIGSGEVDPLADDRRAAPVVAVEEGAQQVAPGLADSGPIPGIAGRDLALADVDRLQPAALLSLRAVEDDFKPVVAIKQGDIVERIALRAVRMA